MNPNATLIEQALTLHKSGKLPEAVQIYKRVLAADPAHADALHYLGLAHLGGGRPKQAIDLIDKSLAARPNQPKALSNLATALQQTGQLDRAVEALEQAIDLAPDFADAHYNLAVIHGARGETPLALKRLRRTLELEPTHVDAMNNMGSLLQMQGDRDEALEVLARALDLAPQNPVVQNNYGYALYEGNNFEKARQSFDQALKLAPGFAEAHYNRGLIDEALGDFEAAITRYREAIRLKPDYAEPAFNIGFLQLLHGNFEQGLVGYEARFGRRKANQILRNLPVPRWDGAALQTERLLVHAEQGLGDSLQFVRFLPMLRQRCQHVLFAVQPPLIPLLSKYARQEGVELCDIRQPLPAHDLHIQLMSLPVMLGVTLDSLPSPGGYLEADSSVATDVAAELGREGLRIGIAWQGNPAGNVDRGRSLQLRAFAALKAARPDIRLISLQKGYGEEQLAEVDFEVESLEARNSFTGTAALMANLDLVVSSDTSIAHLAGALGRPTWIALKRYPDWRWMLDRTDSPWYPATRLFRQRTDGDWESVFKDMAAALAQEFPLP